MVQDQKVLSKMKRLNAQKHVTRTKQQQLVELEREYQRMNAKAGGGAQATDAHARKKEEDAMVVNGWLTDKNLMWKRDDRGLECCVSRSCEHKRTGWRRYSLNARRPKISQLTIRE